jgi:hypothetical protein
MTQLIEAVEGPLDAEEGDDVEFNVFDLFGAKITARVGLEEVERGSRKGEMRNNISRFIPLGGELSWFADFGEAGGKDGFLAPRHYLRRIYD